MFTNIVGKQYIGKAKIDFTKFGKPLDPKNLIRDIGSLFKCNGVLCNTLWDKGYPDFMVTGNVTDISTFDIGVNAHITASKALLITGIPKLEPSLDPYKFREVEWSSYYEDDYRGYLFQIVSLPITLEFKDREIPERYKMTLISNMI